MEDSIIVRLTAYCQHIFLRCLVILAINVLSLQPIVYDNLLSDEADRPEQRDRHLPKRGWQDKSKVNKKVVVFLKISTILLSMWKKSRKFVL